MIVSDAEKAADVQHGVGNITAGLVHHDAIDGTYLRVLGTIDRLPHRFTACDQVARRTRIIGSRRG